MSETVKLVSFCKKHNQKHTTELEKTQLNQKKSINKSTKKTIESQKKHNWIGKKNTTESQKKHNWITKKAQLNQEKNTTELEKS